MTRECIHGNPRTQCPICKGLERISTQQTIGYAAIARAITGTQNRVFAQSVMRLAGLPQNYPNMRIRITDEMRNATRNFIASPRNVSVGDRFRNVMSSALVRAEVNVGGSYSASPSASSSSNVNSPRSSVGTGSRFTRSALSVYSRLGTPNSPNSPRSRRARSGTPVSRFAGPRSPGSNMSNTERFSPPRKKSK